MPFSFLLSLAKLILLDFITRTKSDRQNKSVSELDLLNLRAHTPSVPAYQPVVRYRTPAQQVGMLP
jgi:hypothetical protein